MTTVDVRRLRLGASFVLLTYLTLHLSNHALGLVSLETMEAGQRWFTALWRSRLGTLALYGAFTVHGVLALWLLYRRGSLRMPGWEAAQYGLGLALPALLAIHVVGTRIAWWRVGADDPYARIVLGLWVLGPPRGIWQATTLVVAWIHGGIGLHYWLRFRPWYPRAAPWLLCVALLLPVLALLGFVAAGREVAALARTPGWVDTLVRETHAPRPAESAMLVAIRQTFLNAYLAALVGVLVAREVRRLARGRGAVRVTYPDGRVVAAPRGLTILEVSRLGGIPHASVCGGRGRCSTCRVRGVRGLADLPPPHDTEGRVLARGTAPPDGRLAGPTRDAGPAAGCRQALAAARAMAEGVAALSRELAPELAAPMRIGIGIHVGSAVVGWMGWGDSFYLTAVGDTVHVAARLEQATKDYDCELVISEAVATRAGVAAASFPRHEVALRNRATPVVVRVVARAVSLVM